MVDTKTRNLTILLVIFSSNCLDGKLGFFLRNFVTIEDLLQELQGFRSKRVTVLAKDLEKVNGVFRNMKTRLTLIMIRWRASAISSS